MKRTHNFIYNTIPYQDLTHANQLHVQTWNKIINILKSQANSNTEYLEVFSLWLLGGVDADTELIVNSDTTTGVYAQFANFYEYIKYGKQDKLDIKSSVIQYDTHVVTGDAVYAYGDSIKKNLIGDNFSTAFDNTIEGAKRYSDKNKIDLIGTTDDDLEKDTIEGAKKYAEWYTDKHSNDNYIKKIDGEGERTKLNVPTIKNGSIQNASIYGTSKDGVPITNAKLLSTTVDETTNGNDDNVASRKFVKEQVKEVNDDLTIVKVQQNTNISNITKNQTAIENLKQNKLDKVFTNINPANDLADTDTLIINTAKGDVFKITVAQAKQVFTQDVNRYKGDFLSYQALVNEWPQARPGDYAFVNTPQDDGDTLIMYVWDNDTNAWKETQSSMYLKSTTFLDFLNSLQNGDAIAHTASNYNTSSGTIKEKFDSLENELINTNERIIDVEANQETTEGELLENIKVGDETFQLPTIGVNLSDVPSNSPNKLRKLTIGTDEWSIGEVVKRPLQIGDNLKGKTIYFNTEYTNVDEMNTMFLGYYGYIWFNDETGNCKLVPTPEGDTLYLQDNDVYTTFFGDNIWNVSSYTFPTDKEYIIVNMEAYNAWASIVYVLDNVKGRPTYNVYDYDSYTVEANDDYIKVKLLNNNCDYWLNIEQILNDYIDKFTPNQFILDINTVKNVEVFIFSTELYREQGYQNMDVVGCVNTNFILFEDNRKHSLELDSISNIVDANCALYLTNFLEEFGQSGLDIWSNLIMHVKVDRFVTRINFEFNHWEV